jgi:hypothetical protein
MVDVEFIAMVSAYNGATFGWHISKHKKFQWYFAKV